MKFNTKDLNPGTWFYFNEEKPKEGGVCLRRMNAKESKRIEKITDSIKVEFRKRQRCEVIKRDDKKHDLLFWDYCIPEWKCVEDADGNPIEPTPENKVMLMHGSPGFSNFVADSLEELEKDFSEREEGTPGNS